MSRQNVSLLQGANCNTLKNHNIISEVPMCPKGQNWIPLSNWLEGDIPAFYQGFDNDSCITLYNGANVTRNGRVKQHLLLSWLSNHS